MFFFIFVFAVLPLRCQPSKTKRTGLASERTRTSRKRGDSSPAHSYFNPAGKTQTLRFAVFSMCLPPDSPGSGIKTRDREHSAKTKGPSWVVLHDIDRTLVSWHNFDRNSSQRGL